MGPAASVNRKAGLNLDIIKGHFLYGPVGGKRAQSAHPAQAERLHVESRHPLLPDHFPYALGWRSVATKCGGKASLKVETTVETWCWPQYMIRDVGRMIPICFAELQRAA